MRMKRWVTVGGVLGITIAIGGLRFFAPLGVPHPKESPRENTDATVSMLKGILKKVEEEPLCGKEFGKVQAILDEKMLPMRTHWTYMMFASSLSPWIDRSEPISVMRMLVEDVSGIDFYFVVEEPESRPCGTECRPPNGVVLKIVVHSLSDSQKEWRLGRIIQQLE